MQRTWTVPYMSLVPFLVYLNQHNRSFLSLCNFLLCFSLSTSVPSPCLGSAQVAADTFAKFGVSRSKRKMPHQSHWRCIERERERAETRGGFSIWDINQGKLCQQPFPGWGDGKIPPLFSLGISFGNAPTSFRARSFRAEPRHLVGELRVFRKFKKKILLCLSCLLYQIKTASWGLSVSMNPGGGGNQW